MKKKHLLILLRPFFILVILFSFHHLSAQKQTITPGSQNNFWKNVQFGGGLGLSIGSGYTDVTVSPSAIYNINPIVAVGTALHFGYVSSKNNFSSTLYGVSLIGLVNPIPQIQLSVELEEVNVNTEYKYIGVSNNFWNTALYVGAGYRTGNVTVGARFDVLFDENKGYYSNAFMPFVRVYF
jgi:hypothetical protein